MAGLASTRTFPLRSSFAPSYNMTINLVQQMGPEQAHRLLEQSFAQYQADRSVVGLVRGIERGDAMLGEIAGELGGPKAPILEYARMRARISEMERAQSRASRLQRRQAATDALAALRRGDIINITHGRRGGLAVVLESARDSSDPRPLVLTENRWAGRISSADYSGMSAPVGSMPLPKRVEHRQPRVRRDLASALRSAAAGLAIPAKRRGRGDADGEFHDPELAKLREQLRRHPSHNTPGREEQVRQAERYLRIERDNAQLENKVAAATNSLADLRSDRRAAHRAWLHRRPRRRSPRHRRRAAAGAHLQRKRSAGRRMPAHRRVVRFEARRAGGGGLVGAVREPGRDGPGAAFAADAPTQPLRQALQQTSRLSMALRADEQTHRIAPSREPDDGFVNVIYRWARTGDLAAALAAADPAGSGSPLLAGDFVRWCRQALDLLDQVRNAAPDAEVRATAKRAINDIRRGVVAVDAG